jgi:hypothetical protein
VREGEESSARLPHESFSGGGKEWRPPRPAPPPSLVPKGDEREETARGEGWAKGLRCRYFSLLPAHEPLR